MGHLKKRQKILELFFEEPNRRFHIREISRIAKIPKTTAERIVKSLANEKLVVIDRETVFPSYVANIDHFFYKNEKRTSIINKMIKSGLIEYFEKELAPKCIIVFGSVAKGEYTHESDIDIFVQSHSMPIRLEKYEKQLHHRINIFFEPNISKLSGELLNNVANGFKLKGFLKIK